MIIAFAACGSTKKTTIPKLAGNWQAQPVLVDGDSKDWPSPYPAYDAKAKIGYAMSNDRKHLYITMECGDVMTQMKILRSGMNVWIDTSGAKGQAMVINYPLPSENAGKQDLQYEGQALQNTAEGADREKRMQQRVKKNIDEAIQLSLEGFDACNGGFLVKQTNNCGIVVRMAMDEYNEMIWEAAIPFKALYGKEHIDKNDEGRPISVCFQVKGLKKPEKSKAESAGMNEGSMNTGGVRGGGAPAALRTEAGGAGERESIFETSKTWKQFGLAYKEY